MAAIEIENSMYINGKWYKYAVDQTPLQGSDAFVTSGSMYTLQDKLAPFMNREIVNDVSSFQQDSTSLPTVGLIWQIINQLKSDNNLS